MTSTLLKVGVVGSSVSCTLEQYRNIKEEAAANSPPGIFLVPLHESQVTEARTFRRFQKCRSVAANTEERGFLPPFFLRQLRCPPCGDSHLLCHCSSSQSPSHFHKNAPERSVHLKCKSDPGNLFYSSRLPTE